MKFFYDGMELEVPKNVYYPKEDSLLLADYLSGLDLKGRKVLDIGCGSGILSLVCAKRGAKVLGVDINIDAVKATLSNAMKNNLSLKVILGDLFNPLKEKFDIIVFNSPYLPKDEIDRSKDTSDPDAIKFFLDKYKNYLLPKGYALLLISSLTNLDVDGEIVARKKLPWEEIVIMRLV